MIQLTDDDLMLRVADTEDNFVERKTQNDLGDCLKTAVAFANSTPVGYPAIMFVGVTNTGQIEGVPNPDNIQKSVSEKIARAYPPIYTVTRILSKEGKQFLAVVIPGSENRPHFAGQSYIRDGSQSMSASKAQFESLVAQRNSKTYEILKWKAKSITVGMYNAVAEIRGIAAIGAKPPEPLPIPAIVVDCTQFYVTLRKTQRGSELISFPLSTVEISFDHKNDRLALSGVVVPYARG